MKIVDNRKQKESKPFKEINISECFTFEGKLYMKIDVSNANLNVWSIERSVLVNFQSPNTLVFPVKTELHIID